MTRDFEADNKTEAIQVAKEYFANALLTYENNIEIISVIEIE